VFISFDYDHDRDLKNLLVGQSRNKDSPFFIEDHSIKAETKRWKDDARERIRRSDVVIVVCGLHTHQAVGVSAEIAIAREEETPFHLLRGRREGTVRRPQGTSWFFDELHPWTWNELRVLTTRKEPSWWAKIW
jgi:antiphage defense system Thoeris ThsB-like protein